MRAARFLKCSKELRWLNPLFKELKGVIGEYVDWEGQPPYWYNESASVSMLVAAGARKGYIVLSDYRTAKILRRRSVKGRCDLLIGKDDKWLALEAKQAYLRRNPDTIVNAILGATAEAKRHDPQYQTKHGGLVVAVTSTKADPHGAWQVKAVMERYRQASTDCDLCWVWYQSKADDTCQAQDRFYPGVAVFLKVC